MISKLSITSRALSVCIAIALAALLMIPATAFAAIPMQGTSSKTQSYQFGGKNYQAYSRAEFHSDAYANGFAYTRCTSGGTIPAYYMTHNNYLYVYVIDKYYLVESKTNSPNTTTCQQNKWHASQIWAPCYSGSAIKATGQHGTRQANTTNWYWKNTSVSHTITINWPL